MPPKELMNVMVKKMEKMEIFLEKQMLEFNTEVKNDINEKAVKADIKMNKLLQTLKETELLDDNAIFFINSLSEEDRAEMAEANAMREAMEAEMKKNNLDVNGKKKGGGGILSQLNELKANQEKELAEMKEL